MNTDKVYGHKTFIEGTEVGFKIYKDAFIWEIIENVQVL